MSSDERDALPHFVQEAVGDNGGSQETLARELDSAMCAVAAALPPGVPAQSAKSRLLTAATTGPLRYAPFFDRLVQMFDLERDSIIRVLQQAASESDWEPGPRPSIRVLHFQAGPALAGADTGLVRMPPAFAWPLHRHAGVERVLILEGEYREGGGRVYRAGDMHEMGPGSQHSFTVPPGAPLLFAVALFGEIEIL
jgi:hypothetical protein